MLDGLLGRAVEGSGGRKHRPARRGASKALTRLGCGLAALLVVVLLVLLRPKSRTVGPDGPAEHEDNEPLTSLNGGVLANSAELHDASMIEANKNATTRVAVVVLYYALSAREFGGATDSHFLYARRHGYALVNLYSFAEVREMFVNMPEEHRPYFPYYGLAKILANFDVLLWLDQETIILNHSITVESLLDTSYDITVAAGAPNDPALSHIFGTEALLVRNTRRSLEVLQAVWAMRYVDCNKDPNKQKFMLNSQQPACVGNGWWRADVGAFNWLVQARQSISCRFRFLPRRELGSPFPDYGNGDFLLLLAGTPLAVKLNVTEAFRRPELFPDDPRILQQQYYGAVEPLTGTVDVSKAPQLEIKPSGLNHKGPEAVAAYAAWNRPC